ncbi:hypothetical protein D3C85_754280 [compost metagenome]
MALPLCPIFHAVKNLPHQFGRRHPHDHFTQARYNESGQAKDIQANRQCLVQDGLPLGLIDIVGRYREKPRVIPDLRQLLRAQHIKRRATEQRTLHRQAGVGLQALFQAGHECWQVPAQNEPAEELSIRLGEQLAFERLLEHRPAGVLLEWIIRVTRYVSHQLE